MQISNPYMKKSIAYLSVTLLVLAAAACTKGGLDPDLIAFTVAAPSADADVVTRASVVNTANLASFDVACTTGGLGVSESAVWVGPFTGTGTYTGGKYWPSNDDGYHFYASNASLQASATGCVVVADSGTDVVVAYLPNPLYRESNALVFNHVFARVGDVTVSAKEGYTLSDVTVSLTPVTGGRYDLRTGNNKTDGTGWLDEGRVTGSPVNIAPVSGGVKSNDIYLMPGTYELEASWTATKGAFVQSFSAKKRQVSFVAGRVNRLSTTLGGNASDLVFTVDVAPWTDNAVEAQF